MAKKTDQLNQAEARRLRRWLDDECDRLQKQGKGPTPQWRKAEAQLDKTNERLPWWRKGW